MVHLERLTQPNIKSYTKSRDKNSRARARPPASRPRASCTASWSRDDSQRKIPSLKLLRKNQDEGNNINPRFSRHSMQQPQILPSEPRSGLIRNPETPDTQARCLFLHSQKHQRRHFWARLKHCSTWRYRSRAGYVDGFRGCERFERGELVFFARLAVL